MATAIRLQHRGDCSNACRARKAAADRSVSSALSKWAAGVAAATPWRAGVPEFLREEMKPTIEAAYPLGPKRHNDQGAFPGLSFAWTLPTEPESFPRYIAPT